MEGLKKVLATAAWDELQLFWGVDDAIRKLQGHTETIEAVLPDAEARAIDDMAVRKWLRDINEVAFDAEDVLDELQTEASLREGKEEKVLCCPFYYFCTLLFRYKMARNIRGICKRFDEVAERRRNFHLAERAAAVSHPVREEFSSKVKDAEIFGREDDKEKVIEWLTTQVDKDNRDLSVLPIVGLGGLGKTTLARMVFNDERTVKHFELRMWVCVGEDFDLKTVAKAMLERDSEAQSVSTLDGMYRLIQEKVTNKRYLLILDDVWCEDVLELEKLRDLLRGSSNGSKVVVTTRSREVARIVGTAESAHELKGLTDDDCWMLFKHMAFGPGRAARSPNLDEIGKKIVRRCSGVPLAIKSLGGLMAKKTQESEWLDIENSENWNLVGDAGRILPALKLSYDQLSPQLKRCFTYCAVFPKNRKIQKSRLIQLWMSQGFIQSNSGMNLEDIGTQYFNTLLNISFFQDEKKDEYGNIESCEMHDLVRDLACLVAKDESSIVKADKKISLPQGCRYASIISHEGPDSSTVEIASGANKLRSFFLMAHFEGSDDPKLSKEVSKLTRLRALHLDCISGGNIFGALSELKHLRFLELSRLKVEALPDSIAVLRNLQTLNLGRCKELKELPKGMMTMGNLRHLVMRDCERLDGMPRGIGGLINIQTLSWFRVGGEESHASIDELRHLNQIKGDLTIDGLDNVEDPRDALEASLSSKVGLLSLRLRWLDGINASTSGIDVLENLQPHRNLKGLSIENYRGSRFPSWFANIPSSSLPNLVHLSLGYLPALEELPPLGQLPSLKGLHLRSMEAIKKVGKEMYGESSLASAVPFFPSLKILTLWHLPELEEWYVPERGAFTSLESLRISGCRKFGTMANVESGRGKELEEQNQHPPSFLSLSLLDIEGCYSLTVLPGWLSGILSLQSLRLSDCPSLQMLPDWIQHLSRLEDLTIEGCHSLQMLPDGIQHLSGLQILHLYRCPNLRMLPDGIQQLSGLQLLSIRECPHLERRCERETGEDWLKISHIPLLDIWYNT